MIKHTEEQLKFINHNYEDSIILNATAGSGKTQSAISRVDKMIADGIDPNEIIFFSVLVSAVIVCGSIFVSNKIFKSRDL